MRRRRIGKSLRIVATSRIALGEDVSEVISLSSFRSQQRLRQVPLQTLFDTRPDRLERQTTQHIGRERTNQQMPRFRVAQSPRSEIEQGLIVELPDGGAV